MEWESRLAAWVGVLLFYLGVGPVLAVWAWMVADCIAELAKQRTGRLVAWLAVMFALGLPAYLYYFLEKRPRESGSANSGAEER